MELYLDRLDLLRTNIENSINENKSINKINISDSLSSKNEEIELNEKLSERKNKKNKLYINEMNK